MCKFCIDRNGWNPMCSCYCAEHPAKVIGMDVTCRRCSHKVVKKEEDKGTDES